MEAKGEETVGVELSAFIQSLEKWDSVRPLTTTELATKAQPFGKPTAHGSLGFFSYVRSRSAGYTVVLGSERVQQKSFSATQRSIVNRLGVTLATLKEYLHQVPPIRVQRTIGANAAFNPKCTLYLSSQRQDSVSQAYLWAQTLREGNASAPGPELSLVCVPEWPEQDRQVLVFPEERLTIVLGSDYVGEVKMGFLRMAMWEAKQKGRLGLHAGSKLVRARQRGGQPRQYGMLLFGLSGTGKTTHICHDHGLDADGEAIEILQDDVVFLQKDGAALGTEQGFYLKTEGVSPEDQPIVYRGLRQPNALFENVMIDYQGNLAFRNVVLTGNGRAVIPRENLAPYASHGIDLPPVSQLDGLIMVFITRRMTVLPPLTRLTPEQGAAAFMLGESVETSAGDPRRAGESVRVVGTNPFLIGDEAEEGNWLHDFLQQDRDKVRCYLLNTGGVGEVSERDAQGRLMVKQRALRAGVAESAALLRGILRDTTRWEREPYFGTQAPTWVDGVEVEKFRLDRFYTQGQIEAHLASLKRERCEWLAQFPGLHQEIVRALL